MPIPSFVVYFRQKHGRSPKPEEIPFPVRVSLQRCIASNEYTGCWSKTAIKQQKKMLGLPVVIHGNGESPEKSESSSPRHSFRPQLVSEG